MPEPKSPKPRSTAAIVENSGIGLSDSEAAAELRRGTLRGRSAGAMPGSAARKLDWHEKRQLRGASSRSSLQV